MSTISFGDLAQTLMLRRQNSALKAEMTAASAELVSGKVSDAGKALRGDFSPLAALDGSLQRLSAFKSATTEAGLIAGAMQTVLGTVSGLATSLGSDLLTAATATSLSQQVDAVGSDARQKFGTAIAALNTRFADRVLFGGVETGRAPLPDADTLLADVEAALTGAVSAADVEAAVAGWFDDPGGFAAQYQGGAARDPLPIGPGEEVALTLTALDPGLRTTLKGLATAALLDRGVLAGQPTARADLARRAGEQLAQSASARTALAAHLGIAEQAIEAAATRNAAESTSLEIARNGMVGADQYAAAARLEATETQLQSLYTITARLSRLSLVDYIR